MREANKAIGRKKHSLPSVDDLIADLSSLQFSASWIWQTHIINLSWKNQVAISPHFQHMQDCAGTRDSCLVLMLHPEIFQRTIADLLCDIPGARNLSDDIIVYGKTQAKHDENLRKTLKRLQEKGAKLNREKCKFSVNKLTFCGHVFSDKGISVDHEKIKSIVDTDPPKNVAGVPSFLAMIQCVSRFIPQYATLTEPLRRLNLCVDWQSKMFPGNSLKLKSKVSPNWKKHWQEQKSWHTSIQASQQKSS